MKQRLRDLASIETGYTVRRPPRNAPLTEFPLLQIGNIGIAGNLVLEKVSRVKVPPLHSDQVLKAGDILFCARGTRANAAVYGGVPMNALAGSQLLVIRAKSGRILPEYLAWYINQVPAQKYFAGRTAGSYVPIVHKQTVEDLPVVVPPMAKQKACVELEKLTFKEQSLTEKLRTTRLGLMRSLSAQALSALED